MKREYCPKCHYLLVRCLCTFIVTINSPQKIIIFRDIKEKKHALNSVNILQLNLLGLSVYDFNLDEEIGNKIIKILSEFKNPALFFPTEAATNLKTSSPNELSKDHDVFILLDGTWKKSKKILFKSPTLQNIKSFKINPEVKSLYTLRQSNLETSLSTIEATVTLLNHLNHPQSFDDLLLPFKKLIDFQIEKMGTEIFNNNYKKKGSD